MSEIIKTQNIENRIFTIRGKQVMIDRDLAELYQVPTKRLNEQVKRNLKRFPESFRFQLTNEEKNKLVAICDRFTKLKHSSVNPYAFTEQGVAMLSAVLHSDIAIEVSIKIMEAFVKMRQLLMENAYIFQKFEQIEKKLIKHDENFEHIFDALQNNEIKKTHGIFFNGQIFDAYKFVAKLIRSAKRSIILIDNFIDETVLTLFTKRKKKVKVSIYTRRISKQLKLDLQKFNQQYEPIEIIEFPDSHDRFLIIDEKEIYHFGASLKDFGKKWFAFSKFDNEALQILAKLKLNG